MPVTPCGLDLRHVIEQASLLGRSPPHFQIIKARLREVNETWPGFPSKQVTGPRFKFRKDSHLLAREGAALTRYCGHDVRGRTFPRRKSRESARVGQGRGGGPLVPQEMWG